MMSTGSAVPSTQERMTKAKMSVGMDESEGRRGATPDPTHARPQQCKAGDDANDEGKGGDDQRKADRHATRAIDQTAHNVASKIVKSKPPCESGSQASPSGVAWSKRRNQRRQQREASYGTITMPPICAVTLFVAADASNETPIGVQRGVRQERDASGCRGHVEEDECGAKMSPQA